MSAYEVKLQIFEGPLDLLLFLIRKEEIDIYEISISKIAKQYLEYVEFIQMFDLDIAGEFIVMAATLMRIKVKTMLSPMGEEDEEVEDFKSELVKNLLEYKRYKEASESFSEFESEERQRFVRSFSYEQEVKQTIDYSLSEEYSIFDLMSILKSVIDRKPQIEYYNVNDNTSHTAYGATWHAQTFAPHDKLILRHLRLKMSRNGTPGTVSAS